jgi:hypothetical protein
MRSPILILTAAVVAAAAQAQPVLPGRLVVNVPFAFNLGTKSMPAGRYEIAAGTGGSLWIKTGGKTAISLFRSRTVEPEAKGRMRFDCYGEANKCFLRQVVAAGSEVAMTFSVSKMEKEYRQSGQPSRVAFAEAEPSHAASAESAAAAE